MKTTKSYNGKYDLDLVEVMCNCRDFKFRKSHYPQDNPQRLCKHLIPYQGEIQKNLKKNGKTKFSRPVIGQLMKCGIIPVLEDAGIEQFEFCGSWRRNKDEIGDVDVLVLADEKEWKKLLDITKVLTSEALWEGDKKFSFVMQDIQVDYRRTDKESWIPALMYFTGSKGENIRLRKIAMKKGMKLNEYGLWMNKKRLRIKTEDDVYRLLGEDFVMPQDR